MIEGQFLLCKPLAHDAQGPTAISTDTNTMTEYSDSEYKVPDHPMVARVVHYEPQPAPGDNNRGSTIGNGGDNTLATTGGSYFCSGDPNFGAGPDEELPPRGSEL